MADLIDRQTTIDAILKETAYQSIQDLREYAEDHGNEWCGGIVDAIDAVIAVTSVEPEQEPTLDQIREYCKKRCLVLITAELYNKLTRTAQPDLQPTCNQLATDCISRKAAIDVVRKWFALVGLNGDICIDGIVSLPSAQPEQKWVLCSKRLPEDDGDYLILCRTWSKHKPYVYDVATFTNDLYRIDEYDFRYRKGEKAWLYLDSDYGFREYEGVYAWMPLPEPYREEGEK